VQFHTPSASERSSLANATRRVYDTFRSRAGADGARLLDEILANR